MTFSDTRIAAVSCALLLIPFWLIYGPLFPDPPVNIGEDFSIFYTDMLAGYFWVMQNGWLDAPWFSPAQCAGFPYLPHLDVSFYSVPQLLTLAGGPTFAVRATVVIFAGLGYLGAFALARDTFRASIPAAGLAGVFMMFNAFFAYQTAAGHLHYHSFMLIPGTAWILLGGGARENIRRLILRGLLAGGIFALMFQGGTAYVMFPGIAAIVGFWAVVCLRDGRLHPAPVMIFALAAVIALLLSAARLQAALTLFSQFPRTDAPLPGFTNLWDALAAPFQAVFLFPPVAWAEEVLTNHKWNLPPHEWKYGVSAAALIVLLAGAARRLWTARAEQPHAKQALRLSPARMCAAAVLAAVLVLPVAVNLHGETWTAFLKSIPVIEKWSSMVRWYAVYTLLAAVCAGCALDWALKPGRARIAAAAVAAAAVMVWSAFQDDSRDEWHSYDARPVENAWRAADGGAPIPVIQAIVMPKISGAGVHGLHVSRINAMVRGESQLLCYNALMGYQLEHLPLGDTVTGDITEEDGYGGLNIKNPACYLYPGENSCRPGDSFLVGQKDAALAFAAYRPFPFERPLRHDIAVWVNLGAFLLFPFAVVFCAWPGRRPRPENNQESGA
ncbi:MAG: hypothetical protein ACYYKD_05920 [Rhodospirillales bacterium]